MKINYLLIVLSLLVFSIPSCQRPLEDDEIIYLGAWSSSRHFIEIAANGFGFYQRRNRDLRDCRVNITRRRIIFNWDGGRKSFRIDTPPSIELTSGRIYMTLDGRDFYRH